MRLMMKRQRIPKLGPHNAAEEGAQESLFTYGVFEEIILTSPVRTTLHRHSFLELAVFWSGAGEYLADFDHYQINAPCAVLIPAGVAHQWPDALRLKGHIVAFDLEYLAATGRNSGPASILRPPVPIVIDLSPEELIETMSFMEKIAAEYTLDCLHVRDAIRAHLSLLLIHLRRLHDRRERSSLKSIDSLYAAFLDQLEEHWKMMRSPKELAAKLNVSPDHLAATLRKACGKNTSELIQERVLLEAKRMLCHSRMSVSEVAYDLGYEDPSYFTRFFKKHVEMTPKSFRSQYQ